MKTYCYNVEDGEFMNAAGEKLPRCVPELNYQEHAVWKFFLRDRENRVCDISAVTAWSAAVDNDFRAGTPPMCRTLSPGIAADAAAGSVSVTLDAATAEFLEAVDGSRSRNADFELCGFDAEGRRIVYLSFAIAARMILDPDPETPVGVPETLATKSFVSSLLVSGAASALSEVVSGALADYPVSSGAETIASGAAANVVSDALVSGGYVTSSGASTIASDVVSRAVVSGGYIDSSTAKNIAYEQFAENISNYPSSGAVTDMVNSATAPFAVAQVVTSSDVTSATLIASGGTTYIFTQPLSALILQNSYNEEVVIGGKAYEARLMFTLASGGSVVVPDHGWLINNPTFVGGSSYVMCINELGIAAGTVEEIQHP